MGKAEESLAVHRISSRKSARNAVTSGTRTGNAWKRTIKNICLVVHSSAHSTSVCLSNLTSLRRSQALLRASPKYMRRPTLLSRGCRSRFRVVPTSTFSTTYMLMNDRRRLPPRHRYLPTTVPARRAHLECLHLVHEIPHRSHYCLLTAH